MTITQKIFAVFSLLCSMALMPQEAQARINFTGYSDAQLQSILCTGEKSRCYSNITYNGTYIVAITPYCKKISDDYWCSNESDVITMRAEKNSVGVYTLIDQWFAIRSDWEERTGYIYKDARVPGEYKKMIGYHQCRTWVGTDIRCEIQYEQKVFDDNGNVWVTNKYELGKTFEAASHSCRGVWANDSVRNEYPNNLNPPEWDSYYLPSFGCTTDRSALVDKIPTTSDCERCDPASELAQLANPVISSMPGDKVSILTGDNTQIKNDINGSIVFTRIYNSRLIGTTNLGIGWRHNYDKKLEFVYTDNIENLDNPKPSTLIFTQENDNTVIFSKLTPDAPFTPALPSQSEYKLIVEGINYILVGPNGTREKYNEKGQLVRISYRNGTYLSFTYDTDGKLILIHNHYNHSLRLTYSDYADVVVKVSSTWGDYVDYKYDNGRIVNATFRNVEPVKYEYLNGKLTSITSSSDFAYSHFTYDEKGRVSEKKNVSQSTGAHNQYNFTYSDTGTAVIHNGVTSNYNKEAGQQYNTNLDNANLGGMSNYHIEYNANGMVQRLMRDNHYTNFEYAGNRLSKKEIPGTGIVSTYTWNNELGVISGTSENSANGMRNTVLEHDAAGNVTKRTINSSSGSRTWTYTYTSYGRVLTSTDPSGATTTYTYYPDDDAHTGRMGQVKSITNALGHSITINAYDEQSNPISITSNGITKTMTYAYKGRVLSESVSGMTKTYEYDANGNVSKVVFPNGYQLTYIFDEINRLTATYDNHGGSQLIMYDKAGNVSSNRVLYNQQDIGGYRQTYDGINRPKIKRNLMGEIVEVLNYDYRGDVGSSTNAIDQYQTYAYDNARRLLNEQTETKNKGYTYDPDSNITSIRINNQTTHYGYNDFAEIVSINSPDTGITQFNHDAASRTTSKTDSDGTNHLYTKDALGRVVQIAHNSAMVESFIYDTNGIGKLAKITDASGNTTFNYNALGAITSKTQVVNGISHEIKYGYDNLQQLTSMTYPSGAVVNYGYTNGKVSSISINNNTIVSNITYYPFTNQPMSWNWGSGGSYSKQYNAAGKLVKVSDTGLMDKSITMDGLFTIHRIQDTFNYAGNDITAYYNKNQQLGMVNINGVTNEYNHEDDMNRVESSHYTYTYNGNKINSVRDNRTGQETDFEYDRRGNTRFNDRGEFAYDLKNNLVMASTDDGYATYKFNALNQRMSKTVGITNTYFVYDGSDMIGEYDANGNVLTEHIYIAGVPIGVLKNNQVYFVHTDEINTPRIITNGSNIVWRWDNTDAFGGNQPVSNNFEYNLRFAGQYFDNESKLHYNYYRTYDPRHGRYMQSDPIGLNGGDHTYNYVDSNPLSAVDPLGLALWIEGASNSEPAAHLGLAIGDPNGNYITVSFAALPNCFGCVYQEEKENNMGNIISMLDTTPELEKKIIAELQEMSKEDNNNYYGFHYTCIGYTQEKYEYFKKKYNLKEISFKQRDKIKRTTSGYTTLFTSSSTTTTYKLK